VRVCAQQSAPKKPVVAQPGAPGKPNKASDLRQANPSTSQQTPATRRATTARPAEPTGSPRRGRFAQEAPV
jgi:hypothetical protein